MIVYLLTAILIGHLTWYEDEIKELNKSPIVNVCIYVTSKTDPIVTSQPVEEAAAVENDVRRSLYIEVDESDDTEGELSSDSNEILDALGKELGMGRQGLGALEKELGIGKQGDSARDRRISKRFSNRFSANLEAQMDQKTMSHIETLSGRPDLTSIIRGVVKSAEQRDTVAVGGNSFVPGLE